MELLMFNNSDIFSGYDRNCCDGKEASVQPSRVLNHFVGLWTFSCSTKWKVPGEIEDPGTMGLGAVDSGKSKSHGCKIKPVP